MKKNIIYKIPLLLCITTTIYSSEELRGISIFSPRAQNDNAARDISGWHPYIHRYDQKNNYVSFAVTPSYNQSLRPERISLALFNNDTFAITGSQIPDRENTNNLLADYFGLSPNFSSDVFFKPCIKNLILDGVVYVGFNSWLKNLYLQLRSQLVWTQWNLHMSEQILQAGTVPFPAGYMGPTVTPAPYESFTQALRGTKSFGEVERLLFGKVNGAQAISGIANVEIVLGYDFICREDAHFGINVRVGAPTGSRTKGKFFFEPRVGNGKLWQCGIGFTGHTKIWEKDGDQQLGFFVDANFTHFCRGNEQRSFDFLPTGTQATQIGFFSRYILAKEFNNNEMFDEKILPSINFTTLTCSVHVDIQMDAVLMFGYTYKDFLFDIGYNGWIRSREKVSLKECVPANRFGLKGVQFAIDPFTQTASNITESTATIFETQPIVPDNPSPVFVTTADLNLRSAASPLLLTHKFFWHFAYAFTNQQRRSVPFIGIGAEIEFEGINERNAYQPDRTTMGQASVWIKAGCTY